MRNRLSVIVAVVVMAALCVGGWSFALAAEDKYPSKPIKLIVGYGPGGSTDLAARVLASTIPEFLGQAVVVVNMPGAGGGVGFDFVRKAPPDGYTMMMDAIGGNVLVPAMNPTLPYSFDEATFIARTQINPNVLIVSQKSPWKKLDDLTAALKKDPGKYKFSTAGIGNVTHLGPTILLNELGLPVDAAIPVHYESDNAAMLAVMQGEADFCQGNLASFASALKGGIVIGLAMTTPERVKGFDDIPTYTELGYPNISIVGWRGVSGPPGLPEDIAKIWEEALAKTCQSKAWLSMVQKLGDEPGFMGIKDYNEFVRNDFQRYRKLFTDLDILIK